MKKKDLTNKQIKELANLLVDTNKNVYTVCQQEFGIEVNDAVFDRLSQIGDIFKCDRCNRWIGCGFLSSNNELCSLCVEEM